MLPLSPERYAENYSDRNIIRDHSRPPLTYKRQRHARDGQDPKIHSDIFKEMKCKHPCYSHGHIRAEFICGIAGYINASEEYDKYQQQYKRGPYKPEFFADHGKDAV